MKEGWTNGTVCVDKSVLEEKNSAFKFSLTNINAKYCLRRPIIACDSYILNYWILEMISCTRHGGCSGLGSW